MDLRRLEATFENDTVWLSIDQMAELFQRDRSVIGKHVRNIFKEGELDKNSVWASGILKEYIKKGFAMDDDRLKRLGGGNYFEELLSRIRDIRSSEKVFWRKVLEIYATSIDYNPNAEESILFFKQVQIIMIGRMIFMQLQNFWNYSLRIF